MPIINFAVRNGQRVYDLRSVRGGKSARTVLHRSGSDRLGYFNRAAPVSKCFPYEVHNPLLLDGLNFEPGPAYLVGRNWKKAPEKPVALCFGFNDWKLGFMSEYIQNYRTAFVPNTLSDNRTRTLARNVNADVFYVWGYKGPKWLTHYAKKNNIKIIRVEDGFVRSALLGAAHTTPYSLVFDDMGGMHYNADESNRLESILNKHDFKADSQLVADGQDIRAQIVREGISKYNQPTLVTPKDTFSIKTTKRVLVLGQVEKDAAIRMGNPEGWSTLQMIQLARIENPHAEIIYKPHPEVYAGYQKSIFRARQVDALAKILPPDVPVHQALIGIDHVYTITSLTGLEALIRNIKVTVLGTPFYGGWGLTDDRCKFERRERQLTLDELFAGVYLKYPLYLADLDDPVIGLKAAILRISADKRLIFSNENIKAPYITNLAKTAQWPQLVLHPKLQSEPQVSSAQKDLQIPVVEAYIRNLDGEQAKLAVIHVICGWLTDEDKCRIFLKSVRNLISLESFNALLNRIFLHNKSIYLIDQYSWLLEQVDQTDRSSAMIRSHLIENNKARQSFNDELAEDRRFLDKSQGQLILAEKREKQTHLMYKDLLDSTLKGADYTTAMDAAFHCLYLGVDTLGVLIKLSDITNYKFDFLSSIEIASFALDSGFSGIASKAIARIFSMMRDHDLNEFMKTVALYSVALPGKGVNIELKLKSHMEPSEYENNSSLIRKFLFLDNDISIGKVQGWIAADQVERGLEVIETIARTHEATPQIGIAHSQALSFDGQISRGKEVILETLAAYPTSAVYREALRMCILQGDYNFGQYLLKQAGSAQIDLGDMIPRKMYFGIRSPGKAFETFRNFHLKHKIRQHYLGKYVDVPNYKYPKGKVLFLPIFGPGDELRFASIYNEIIGSVPHKKIYIGCEPRLMDLFSRSFPDIEFVPIKRIRNDGYYDVSDYDKVASSTLVGALDNTGVEVIQKVDEFALVSDMLAEVLDTYSDFAGVSYLKADSMRVRGLRKQLPSGFPLVGLSWRSSLATHSRNEHYLTIQELAPILAIDGVQFVNLQYDECDEELAWAEKHFPGKIVNLEDIDQYNDFDSVAALIKCMDLIIAPATTVVELAGALGCPTWLLSNSSELFWREIDDTGTDVWHHSITHVKGDGPKDKVSLVNNLEARLIDYLKTSHP